MDEEQEETLPSNRPKMLPINSSKYIKKGDRKHISKI
jgi:hypothetical protein